MRLAVILALWLPTFYSALAQELKASAAWKTPTIALSKDERISIADHAIQEAISRLNATNGQFSDGRFDAAGAHYAQIAEFDRLTNQTTYKDTLKTYFRLAESARPKFLDDQNYGYAAAHAYAIYQDPDFFELATTSWSSARKYTISSEQAVSGTIETKQFILASSCNGTSLAGGTYFSKDPNDSSLDSLASGMFFILSALLAEATSDQMYTKATIESANFIQSHLLSQSNILWGSIESRSNSSSSCSVNPVMAPHGSGSFIEGLVILAGMSNDTSKESLLQHAISAVTTYLLWHGVDGVYDCHDSGGHYIVRGLAALYEHNRTTSYLQGYIKQYVGVQYNSVIEQARTSNASAIYGLPWTGPPGTSFDGVLQLSAVSVLLGAIQVVDEPLSSTSTSSGYSTSTAQVVVSSAKKNSAGIIAGGVIGGIAVLVIFMTCTLFLHKLHQRRRKGTLVAYGSLELPTPFVTSQNMAFSGILGKQHQRNQMKSAQFSAVTMEGEPSSSRPTDNSSADIVGVNMQTEPATAGNQVGSIDNSVINSRREYTILQELLRLLTDPMSRDQWIAEQPPDYNEVQVI